MIEVDARGLSCPEPLLLTVQALNEANGDTVRVTVSETNARDNILRMCDRRGHAPTLEQRGQDYILTIE